MRANGARGGVAPPRTATDVEYCCCLVSAADDRRARDRVATLATAEFMVIEVVLLPGWYDMGNGHRALDSQLEGTPI